jgi:hypothetical protein
MNATDVFLWLTIIAAGWLALTASWMATVGLFPRFTQDCQQRYAAHGIWALLLGVLVFVPVCVLAVATLKTVPVPAVKALAASLPLSLLLTAVLGSSGLAARIGAGLSAPDDAAPPWRQVQRGGWVLSCSLLMPVLGWFLLLPMTLLSGLGAAVMVGWRRRFPLPAAGPAAG